LASIDQRDVRAWMADLSSQGLAPATVQKAYQILGKVLGAAVDAGMIPQSRCRRVPLPKVEREEMRFLTPAEAATLADAIRPAYRALVLVGAYGGLRIGELAGLRRGRVDLLHGTVEVAEIVTEVRGELCFGPPKTRASRRRGGLPQAVTAELARHLATPGVADEFVFTANPKGGLGAGGAVRGELHPLPLRPHVPGGRCCAPEPPGRLLRDGETTPAGRVVELRR